MASTVQSMLTSDKPKPMQTQQLPAAPATATNAVRVKVEVDAPCNSPPAVVRRTINSEVQQAHFASRLAVAARSRAQLGMRQDCIHCGAPSAATQKQAEYPERPPLLCAHCHQHLAEARELAKRVCGAMDECAAASIAEHAQALDDAQSRKRHAGRTPAANTTDTTSRVRQATTTGSDGSSTRQLLRALGIDNSSTDTSDGDTDMSSADGARIHASSHLPAPKPLYMSQR